MGTSELVNGLKAQNCTYLPDKKGSHPEKKIKKIKKNSNSSVMDFNNKY